MLDSQGFDNYEYYNIMVLFYSHQSLTAAVLNDIMWLEVGHLSDWSRYYEVMFKQRYDVDYMSSHFFQFLLETITILQFELLLNLRFSNIVWLLYNTLI